MVSKPLNGIGSAHILFQSSLCNRHKNWMSLIGPNQLDSRAAKVSFTVSEPSSKSKMQAMQIIRCTIPALKMQMPNEGFASRCKMQLDAAARLCI